MEPQIPNRLRAADNDRQRVADAVQAAGAEGRLTFEEIEDRLSAVYAARYTDELGALTADLPKEPVPRSRRPAPHVTLRIHAAVLVVLAVLLTVRWAVSPAPFFWPVAPIFWLAMSLAVHARIRGARHRRSAFMP
ncbi:MAG: hypothetical protein JWQ81_4242 [Amycolatopsis sp.]|uniref:DUF1707 SHOCT-like domain-containing protein n=1 Tax=Amycolatopsis sp. TaxID=37632 RepID=UPI00261C89F7|nr:DUF1707 domain-containing protein [Amycolatopsis sp.]MCU1683503.1 hypothetical protein [Amycolatopsis sp.]